MKICTMNKYGIKLEKKYQKTFWCWNNSYTKYIKTEFKSCSNEIRTGFYDKGLPAKQTQCLTY